MFGSSLFKLQLSKEEVVSQIAVKYVANFKNLNLKEHKEKKLLKYI